MIRNPIRGITKDGRLIGTEESVVKACRQLLVFNGARVHRYTERIPPGKHKWERHSESGIPDMFFWWPAPGPRSSHGTIYMEVKRPGKEPTPAQMQWICQARADGIVAFWADSIEMMATNLRLFGIELRGIK